MPCCPRVTTRPSRCASIYLEVISRETVFAAVLSEEVDAIEDIYEPYLLQIGFLQRTPRGRVATQLAYTHLGIPYRPPQAGLF